MIIRDFSPIKPENGSFSFSDRIRGTMRYGISWYQDMQSQQIVVDHLRRALSNEYVLLRNIRLPDLEVPIPLTLIGPPGVKVLYPSGQKGVFRTKGETWMVMGGRAQQFKPARLNLVTRTLLLSRTVETYLIREDQAITKVEGVLILTDPRSHVDTVRPAVRIVLRDALERFATRVTQAAPVLAAEDVQEVVATIVNPHEEREREEAQARETRYDGARASVEMAETRLERLLASLQSIFDFSTRQWILLIGIIVVEVILLIVFILFIFLSS